MHLYSKLSLMSLNLNSCDVMFSSCDKCTLIGTILCIKTKSVSYNGCVYGTDI